MPSTPLSTLTFPPPAPCRPRPRPPSCSGGSPPPRAGAEKTVLHVRDRVLVVGVCYVV